MSTEYRHNHYVPEWYQRRFIPPGQKEQELLYLDLNPGTFTDPRGVVHERRALYRQGVKHCFAERDLYTTRFGSIESVEIERQFFGDIDRRGRTAVAEFEGFAHPWRGKFDFNDLLLFMSTQKLRTPKGLRWLAETAKTTDQAQVLGGVVRLRQIHCAMWTECVWLLADASASPTKFIVSDHPVTVYNRRCGPRSQWCRGYNDPDIRYHGTHTIFPLSLERILILTNLSWVRNPYQSETGYRPNPNPFRSAMMFLPSIQTLRHLGESEVREINFILKSRALRFVAAGKEEWLHPESHVTKADWNRYGNGYLFMPDPRSVPFTGEILIGFKDGRSTAFDEYGRRPWDSDFRASQTRKTKEWRTLQRFCGEFARMFGPKLRGRTCEFGALDEEEESEELHTSRLKME